MTTIAFDGKTIAADRQHSDDWGLKGEGSKLFVNDHVVIGFAGDRDMHLDMVDALCRAAMPKAPQSYDPAKDVTMDIVLAARLKYDPDGKRSLRVMAICRQTKKIAISNGERIDWSEYKQFAVGSGRDFALGAMHHGATAKQAVETANHFEINTGSDIDVVEV
jgi:ATP-dependent protease HslVU (ClpYQ) peptidase subunit